MTYKPLLIMERAGLYLTVFLRGADPMNREHHGSQVPIPTVSANVGCHSAS